MHPRGACPWGPPDLAAVRGADKCSTEPPGAPGLAVVGFSMHAVGERLFSILILKFGLRRAEIACPALRGAAVSCCRAPGCPCPEPCPYTSPSLVTAAQPFPSRSQTRRHPSRKLRDLCAETPFLNHVFFMCVVNTFLLLILKAKIYPLLIFVLF